MSQMSLWDCWYIVLLFTLLFNFYLFYYKRTSKFMTLYGGTELRAAISGIVL